MSAPRVRKAVILAAGYGTRLLPATKAVPKEALPLVDRPIIQYAVEEVVAAGVEQVVIVTASSKRAVEDHFDRAWELEAALAAKGDESTLQKLRRVSDLAEIVFVRQHEQRGVGDAVLKAKNVVGGEPFVLVYPDDVIVADPPVAKQLIDVFADRGGSVLAVEPVPEAEIANYGVIDADSLEGDVIAVKRVVEKPAPAEAPSNLTIVGRYVLTPGIFDALARTKPGKGGELQLTDGVQTLLQSEPVYAYRFRGQRFDVGRPLGLLKASVQMGLQHEEIGPEFAAFLRGLRLPP